MRHGWMGAALWLLVACNDDPAEGKAVATVSEPAAPAQPAAPATGALKYGFSNAGSTLAFVGAKVTKKHDGSFGVFSGDVLLVDNDPAKSSVEVEITLDSLVVDDPKLTTHLKSADFFDVSTYPKARFVSTSVKAGGDKGSHTITGNLDLHGVTKSLSFPANVRIAGNAVDVDAEFAINRKDFNIVYPGMPDDLIKDEVLIKLSIHATPGQS